MRPRNIALIVAGVTAVATVALAADAWLPNQDAQATDTLTSATGNELTDTGGGNAVDADEGGVGVGGDNSGCVNVVDCILPLDPKLADEQNVTNIYRPVDPTGTGPWPFTVLQDDDDGLWVRNGPDMDDTRIGYAAHATTVWVDCVLTSDFNPDPGRDVGPTWYQVRWPSNEPSEAPMSGEPVDPSQGYAFVGYLAPNGHNGEVPQCEAATT